MVSLANDICALLSQVLSTWLAGASRYSVRKWTIPGVYMPVLCCLAVHKVHACYCRTEEQRKIGVSRGAADGLLRPHAA